MCGINGFTFHGPDLVQKMNQATHHRGPDSTAFWCGEGISLGHNRLAIIDLSERAAQPMWDAERRYAIVFNGEIYNFQELRTELQKKYTFTSDSDTEVILYGYREYGSEIVKKLNGIFALAIWDTRDQSLFVARDHMGIKPLYYYHAGQQFIFSSEIKGILAHDLPRHVEREAASFFFKLLYIPEPLTLFKGIYKLPAAHYGIFKNGQFTKTRYWQVEDFSNLTSRREAAGEIRRVFDDAVQRQLISDRPVGIFLSGGLDSTAVLGAAKKYLPGKIKTFSVSFDFPEYKFNADAELARKTAAWYGADHAEVKVSATDIKNNLENIAWHLDQPNFNPTAAAMYLLSKRAKEDVAVVLGGDGADELFGGYPRYYYSRLISVYQKIPQFLRFGITPLAALFAGSGAAEKLKLPPGGERVVAFLAQKEEQTRGVFNPEFMNDQVVEQHFKNQYFSQGVLADFEKQFMNIDRQSWLADESLSRTDTMTMAFGLEERVPILDRRLVELAYRIPTAWKIPLTRNSPRHFQGKAIWREAIKDYLPPHVLHQEKRGWFTPMAKWLRTDLKETVADILSPANLDAEFFDAAAVQKMLLDHQEGKRYNLNTIWALVMWQLWHREYFK